MNLRLEEQIAELNRRSSLGVVAVVGAGLSVSARFPMTSGLTDLLWDALDHDAIARTELSTELGNGILRQRLSSAITPADKTPPGAW